MVIKHEYKSFKIDNDYDLLIIENYPNESYNLVIVRDIYNLTTYSYPLFKNTFNFGYLKEKFPLEQSLLKRIELLLKEKYKYYTNENDSCFTTDFHRKFLRNILLTGKIPLCNYKFLPYSYMEIYKVCKILDDNRIPIDIVSVSDWLEKNNEKFFIAMGGRNFFNELVSEDI